MMRNTEKRIIDAFLNLAANNTTQTDEYGKITVQMVTQKANITKPTFYKHYKNIYALIDTIKDLVFSPLRDILDHHTPENTFSPFGVIATEVIPLFYEKQDIIRIILSSAIDFNYQQYSENIFSVFFDRFLKKGLSYGTHGLDRNFIASYYAKITIGILTIWLSDQLPESPEHFKTKFLFLINNPPNYFQLE